MKAQRAGVLLAALVWTGCAASTAEMKKKPPMEEKQETKEAEEAREEQPRTHEILASVLWAQTAVEYRATAEQSYELAKVRLDQALEESGWTAALEQTGEEYGELPPAVILDVDETVLDNSGYQARLVKQDASFNPETWHAWCREEKATPIPGALEFTRYAASKGVEVFYVTNRDHSVEEATRQNLLAHGFPMNDDRDVLLTKAEREAWDTSDKTPRRAMVAEDYRVLLLLGDNFGDFVGDYKQSVDKRAALYKKHAEKWGEKWIVLPNPSYGSWMGAIIEFDYGASAKEQSRRKYEALDPKR